MQEKNCLATDKKKTMFHVQVNYVPTFFYSKTQYVFFQTEPNGKFVCSGYKPNLRPVYNECSGKLVNVYSIIYVWCPANTLVDIKKNQPVDDPISVFKGLKTEYEAIKINGDNSVEALEEIKGERKWQKSQRFWHQCREINDNIDKNQIKDSGKSGIFKNFINKNIGKISISIILGLAIGLGFGFVFAPIVFVLFALLMVIDYKIRKLPKPMELLSHLAQGCKNVFGKLKNKPFQLIKNTEERNKLERSLKDEEKK